MVFTFIAEKKIAKKIYNFFSVHQNGKTKKIRNKQNFEKKKFLKIHYFANIKYKRNSRKYCEKNLRRNIFVKRKIFAKKNSIIKIFTKKEFVEKNFRKQICRKKIEKNVGKKEVSEKKIRNNFKNDFGNFFIFEKKFGWNSVNLRKKQIEKILKLIFAIFLFLKKNPVKSRLIHQSKDRILSVKMSVNLG